MANFLSKLFKPKWQSKHTATRLEAIKDLNLQTEEDQKILFSLALVRIMFLGISNEEYGFWALLWTIFGYSLLLDFGYPVRKCE